MLDVERSSRRQQLTYVSGVEENIVVSRRRGLGRGREMTPLSARSAPTGSSSPFDVQLAFRTTPDRRRQRYIILRRAVRISVRPSVTPADRRSDRPTDGRVLARRGPRPPPAPSRSPRSFASCTDRPVHDASSAMERRY